MEVSRYPSFEVGQIACKLVKSAYSRTRNFLAEGRLALTNQIHRAAVSIPSTTAEDGERETGSDFYPLSCHGAWVCF